MISATVEAAEGPSTRLSKTVVCPGDRLTSVEGYMPGHGTYPENGCIYASVAGVVNQVNKLICVQPFKSRYAGEVGDVVVGRITEVQQRRWKVETNARLDSVLQLSSVNLPGGELRRKSLEDELMMRQYLQEGDLISAEVQMVFNDGSLSLQTRNLRYGKVHSTRGVLVSVWPLLVMRRKSHFHTLPCGATLIVGRNGNVWISPVADDSDGNTGGYVQNLDQPVAIEERRNVARLANCVRALADNLLLIYDTTIIDAFDFSADYEAKDLLRPEVAKEICDAVRAKLRADES